jgi:basic amino acid/polyamine antiporter, APA family
MAIALHRSLGRWDLTAIVINTVIGAAVLGLPGRLFALLGVFSVAAWALCAVIFGVIAHSFAEAGRRFSATGGPYLYTHTVIGPTAGFLVGWLAWVSRLFSLATIGNLACDYAGGLDPLFLTPTVRIVCITCVFCLLTAPLIAGLSHTKRMNNLFTLLKLVLLCGFTLTLIWFSSALNLAARPVPEPSDWQSAMLQMSFAFVGIEAGMINAGEMRDPARDAPVALWTGLAVVAAIYVGFQIVCIGTVPHLEMSARPAVDAATYILGATGGHIIGAVALICMIGTMYAVTLTGSRLPYAMAERGQLPRIVADIHPKSNTPVISILLTSILAWLLTVYTSFIGALTISATTRIIGYLATCVVVLLLRRQRGDARQREARWVSMALPYVAIAACVWLMLGTTASQWMSIASISVGGLLICVMSGIRRN